MVGLGNIDDVYKHYLVVIKENAKLKYDVGNLGYKIKNQRHEINNRLKEIDKLKELLKECRNCVTRQIFGSPTKQYWEGVFDDKLLTKIDEVLK